jgi:hypothetical protein
MTVTMNCNGSHTYKVDGLGDIIVYAFLTERTLVMRR